MYTISMGIIISLLINGLAVYISAQLIPGVVVNSFMTALVVSVALGIVNTLLKPLLIILTLPATLLTLGLFTFFINALMVYLVATYVPGFHVNGLWAAFLFSITLSIVGWFLRGLTK